MNELGQTLKSGWKSSGSDITPPHIPAQLISEAQRLNRESKKFQWSTLLILGSTFLMNDGKTNTDFTMDVVRIQVNGQWVDMPKVGRAPCDNPDLELIDLSVF